MRPRFWAACAVLAVLAPLCGCTSARYVAPDGTTARYTRLLYDTSHEIEFHPDGTVLFREGGTAAPVVQITGQAADVARLFAAGAVAP